MDDMTEFYLRPKDGPIIPELESLEVVLAKDQPGYAPLRVLRSSAPEGYCVSRWALTADQRSMIADGADIFLVLLTFGNPLQPIQMAVAHEIEPQSALEAYGLSIPDGALPKEI
jgi:hypothetical protein